MAWCEANGAHFLFGLAKTDRLIAEIKAELEGAAAQSRRTGKPARRFKDFRWTTRSSWSRQRRVVAKVEWTICRRCVSGTPILRWTLDEAMHAPSYWCDDCLSTRVWAEELE
jgi:Transposase DDE domain group 1